MTKRFVDNWQPAPGVDPRFTAGLGPQGILPTLTDVAANDLSGLRRMSKVVRTLGYASADDGGGALHRFVDTEPGHPGKAQSLDGGWTETASLRLDPRMFGAKGDGVTNDSQAFRDVIATAALRAPARVSIHLAPGTYLIDPGTLSHNAGTPRTGIRWIGAGRSNTVLKLTSDGVNQGWFYDNGAVSIAMLEEFHGIRFLGADRAFCNGFQLTDAGAGHESFFQFYSCRFQQLGDVLSTKGTTNADECAFVACEMFFVNTVLRLDNPQSMLHHFIACRAWVHRDMVVVEGGGGGEFLWLGGSIIMMPNEGIDRFWLKAKDGPNTSHQTGQFIFAKMRCENRGANAKLVDWPYFEAADADRHVKITFDDANLATANEGTGVLRVDAVRIGAGKFVHFRNCVLPQIDGTLDRYGFRVTAEDAQTTVGNPGTILFEGCTGPVGLRDDCFITNKYGRIKARGMIASQLVAAADRRALDFDMGWDNPLPGAPNIEKKVAAIKSSGSWPLGDGTQEATVMLPAGSIITRVCAYKPAQGAQATLVQFRIGSDDKTMIYGESASARADAEHKIDASVNVAALGANAKVRIWATAGTLAQSGGYAFVEYI